MLCVFISYSHKDQGLKDDLIKHLSPLTRLNLVAEWHDGKIEAGDKWEDAITSNLDHADIIVVIVSIDFINSKYCYEVEMEKAIERASKGDAVLIPVIGRNCMWKTTPFKDFQALPAAGKAIAGWQDRDEALTDVAEGIRVVADRLMSDR